MIATTLCGQYNRFRSMPLSHWVSRAFLTLLCGQSAGAGISFRSPSELPHSQEAFQCCYTPVGPARIFVKFFRVMFRPANTAVFSLVFPLLLVIHRGTRSGRRPFVVHHLELDHSSLFPYWLWICPLRTAPMPHSLHRRWRAVCSATGGPEP